MTKHNIMKLLGILAVLAVVPLVSGHAFAQVVDDETKAGRCRGDCEAPTLALTRDLRHVVDGGITFSDGTTTYYIEAQPFYTSSGSLNADHVGSLVTVHLKAYENSGMDNVRHADLIIGASSIGSKDGIAKIELDRTFDGVVSVKTTDPSMIFTNQQTGKVQAHAEFGVGDCSYNSGKNDCTDMTFQWIVNKPMYNVLFAADIWDSHLQNQMTWFGKTAELMTGQTLPINVMGKHAEPKLVWKEIPVIYVNSHADVAKIVDSKLVTKDAHGFVKEGIKFQAYKDAQIAKAKLKFDSSAIQKHKN